MTRDRGRLPVMAILVAALSGAAVASSLDHASSADRDPGLTSGETALDLTGVAPLNEGAGSGKPRVSAPRFEPPEPGKPRVMDLDVDTLFAALVNHTVVVAFTVKWCALCRGYEAEFSRAAAAFDGLVDAKRSRAPLVFARVDVDDNRALAKSFGVTSVPFVAVMKHKRWYTVKAGETVIRAPKRYNGYLGAAPTVEWINRETGMHAEIRPYVTELTGDTVDAFVNDTNHDVLVEFYASWCGHCKQFAPFFYEVGAHFAADERVRVAKLDVDVHRDAAARYNVTGLPSLQLFPRGYKSRGLHFKGAERKPAAIIAFVKSPQVYLVEAQITDMPEWECVVWLEAKGVLRKGSVTDAVGLMGTPVASGAGKGESGAEDDDEGGEEEEDEKERVARGGGVGGGAGRFTGKVRYRANHANSTAHDQAAREMFAEAHRWAGRRRWLETMEVLTCLSHTKPLRRTGIGSSPAMWNFLDNAKLHVEDPSVAAGAALEMDADVAADAAAAEGDRMNPGGDDFESFGGADGGKEEREATGFDWEAWETFVARDVGDEYGTIPELPSGERM